MVCHRNSMVACRRIALQNGLGIQPPDASLGNMLNGAQSLTVLTKQPWLWLPPGVMIVVLVMAINFVGDALRDALDPNSGKRR